MLQELADDEGWTVSYNHGLRVLYRHLRSKAHPVGRTPVPILICKGSTVAVALHVSSCLKVPSMQSTSSVGLQIQRCTA